MKGQIESLVSTLIFLVFGAFTLGILIFVIILGVGGNSQQISTAIQTADVLITPNVLLNHFSQSSPNERSVLEQVTDFALTGDEQRSKTEKLYENIRNAVDGFQDLKAAPWSVTIKGKRELSVKNVPKYCGYDIDGQNGEEVKETAYCETEVLFIPACLSRTRTRINDQTNSCSAIENCCKEPISNNAQYLLPQIETCGMDTANDNLGVCESICEAGRVEIQNPARPCSGTQRCCRPVLKNQIQKIVAGGTAIAPLLYGSQQVGSIEIFVGKWE